MPVLERPSAVVGALCSFRGGVAGGAYSIPPVSPPFLPARHAARHARHEDGVGNPGGFRTNGKPADNLDREGFEDAHGSGGRHDAGQAKAGGGEEAGVVGAAALAAAAADNHHLEIG
jgi:hypothetical protein